MKELEILLLDQHYPERIIKASIEKGLKAPQSELKNVKEHQKKKILSFILTFNPSNHKILPIIKQTMENLKTPDQMRNALKKVKFINFKRQAPNLGKILCRSSFLPSNSNLRVKIAAKVLFVSDTSRKVYIILSRSSVKKSKYKGYHLIERIRI